MLLLITSCPPKLLQISAFRHNPQPPWRPWRAHTEQRELRPAAERAQFHQAFPVDSSRISGLIKPTSSSGQLLSSTARRVTDIKVCSRMNNLSSSGLARLTGGLYCVEQKKTLEAMMNCAAQGDRCPAAACRGQWGDSAQNEWQPAQQHNSRARRPAGHTASHSYSPTVPVLTDNKAL